MIIGVPFGQLLSCKYGTPPPGGVKIASVCVNVIEYLSKNKWGEIRLAIGAINMVV